MKLKCRLQTLIKQVLPKKVFNDSLFRFSKWNGELTIRQVKPTLKLVKVLTFYLIAFTKRDMQAKEAKHLCTDETKMSLHQNDLRTKVWIRREKAHDQKYITSSVMVEAVLSHDHRWLPLEPNSSIYWGVAADSRLKVYRAAVSSPVQTNDPKHAPKVTQELLETKKWDVLQWPVSQLISREHAF